MPQQLIWDERYSVGDATLDEQHKSLMALCNRLAVCLDEGNDRDSAIFSEIIEQLSAYARVHFQTEENILQACKYPRLDTQQEDHAEYERHVAEALVAEHAGKLDRRELQRLLSGWWNDHILIADLDYREHVLAFHRGQQEGASFLRAADFDAARIVAWRQKSGLSSTAFWRRIGVSRSSGARYEAGGKLPEQVCLLLLLIYGEAAESAGLLARLRQYSD